MTRRGSFARSRQRSKARTRLTEGPGFRPSASVPCLTLLRLAGVGVPSSAAQEPDTALVAPTDTVPQRPQREPCTLEEVDENDWADLLRRKSYRGVCGSALWFDSFFGDERANQERVSTFGYVRAGAGYRQVQGFEPKVRMRLKWRLPSFEERVHIVFGRDDLESLLEDDPQRFSDDAVITREDEDTDDWLLGLGWTPMANRYNRFGLNAGVRLDWPLDPYVQGFYRYQWVLTDRTMARLRQTLFWKNSEGLGETTRMDVDFVPGNRFLLRWWGRGTFSQSTDGYDWRTALILFHDLGGSNALAYQADMRGATQAEVPLREYGFKVVLRHRTDRPWLFVELHTGVAWLRKTLAEERRRNLGIGLGVEIQYGNRIR
jgi:hypothetical protein